MVVRKIAASISFKILAIVGLLAATTAAALIVAQLVIVNIAGLLETLTEERIPEVSKSAELIIEAGVAKAEFSEVLTAPDDAALTETVGNLRASLSRLQENMSALPEDDAEASLSLLSQVTAGLTALEAARRKELKSEEETHVLLEDLQSMSIEISSRLYEAADDAFFDATMGGEDTARNVEESLSALVETDIAKLRAVMRLRADLNLVTGVFLALSQNPEPGLKSILEEIAVAGVKHLRTGGEFLQSSEDTASYAEQILAMTDQFDEILAGAEINEKFALDSRREGDKALSSAIDDIEFTFMINSEEMVAGNREAIKALVDVHMKRIREAGLIDAAVRSVLGVALQSAIAPNAEEVEKAGGRLRETVAALEALNFVPDALVDEMDRVRSIADAETGVIAVRLRAVQAEADAKAVADASLASVASLSAEVQGSAERALARIADASESLSADVSEAEMMLKAIGVAGVLLLIASQAISFLFVSRPIQRLSLETERLSGGDLSELTVKPGAGEIGRMAEALQSFRAKITSCLVVRHGEKKAI